MREIINLTKLFINSNLGVSLFLYNKEHDKKTFSKQLLIMIIVTVSLIPTFVFYVFYMISMYVGLSMINQTSVFLSIGYILVNVLIFIFGIMYILSEFYFSKNVEELLSLPILPRNIIIAKFLSILVIEYLIAGAMFIPVLVIYGIGQGMGLLYTLFSFVVFFTIPILPLGLLTIMIMLIMGVIHFRGQKDVVQILFAFIILGIVFGIQFLIASQNGPEIKTDSFQEMINTMLINNESLLNRLGYFVPTSFLVAWGLNKISFMSIVWVISLLGITALVFWFMVLVGEKFYFTGLINSKFGKKNKEMSGKDRNKALGKTQSKVISVFLMDLRILLRTPIYMFNNVSVVVIIPLCLILVFSFGKMGGEEFLNIEKLYQDYSFIANYIIIAFFLLLGSTTATTSTTFSREGKVSWITRIIPVHPKDQVLGRLLTALFVQGLGIIFAMIASVFFISLTPSTMIITTVLGMIGTIPVLLFGFFIDMHRPLLNWDNPQKAVKNNMNAMIPLFAGSFYIGILLIFTGGIGYFINPWMGYLMYALITLGLSYVLFHLITQRFEECLLKF